MNISRAYGTTPIKSALLVAIVAFAQPAHAQSVSGKQKQAEAIPSTRQALSGRLFYSREERERMDRARAGNREAGERMQGDPGAPGINGFVKRSDSDAIVWVDGQAKLVSAESAQKITPNMVGGSSNTLQVKMSDRSPTARSKVSAVRRTGIRKSKPTAFPMPRSGARPPG